jgi:DNA-binding transcriptional MerR regulator
MPKYLRQAEVAEQYGWPVETLRYWRKLGRGPVSFRAGRNVLYDERDVEAWLAESRDRGAAEQEAKAKHEARAATAS